MTWPNFVLIGSSPGLLKHLVSSYARGSRADHSHPCRKMLKDPELFPNPDKFLPERYMEEVDEVTARKRDPRNYAFGFGRR